MKYNILVKVETEKNHPSTYIIYSNIYDYSPFNDELESIICRLKRCNVLIIGDLNVKCQYLYVCTCYITNRGQYTCCIPYVTRPKFLNRFSNNLI